MVSSVVRLLSLPASLWKYGLGLRLNTFPSEPPGEGTWETPPRKPLGEPLHLRPGISATEAHLCQGGSCGTLFGPFPVLLSHAQRRPPDWLYALGSARCALRQQPLRQLFVDATPLQLLKQGAITPLPRTIARIEEGLSEPLIVDETDFNEACDCGTHVLFEVAGGDEALFETPSRARSTAERACNCLQYIGGLCRCSASFLRFRVAATRHDAPLLRFGSDGDRNLEGCRHRAQLRVDLSGNLRICLEEFLRLLSTLAEAHVAVVEPGASL